MSLSRTVRRFTPIIYRQSKRFGGGHHGPMMPPFARQRPATALVMIEITITTVI